MTPEYLPAACRTGYFGKLRLRLLRKRAFILAHNQTDVLEYRELTRRDVDDLVEQSVRAEFPYYMIAEVNAFARGYVGVPFSEQGVRVLLPVPLPLRALDRLSRFGIDARTHRLFVLPAIQDIHCEHDDARNAGESMRASWTLASGYATVIVCWLWVVVQAVKRKLSACKR